MSRAAVIVFPGSNCEHDAVSGLELAGASAELVWHTETDLSGYDLVVLPGGFAHGDYLRAGALARLSPIMDTVAAFAASGGPVVGICNGFQVLTEAGLLPGALQKNAHLKFHCKDSTLIVASREERPARAFLRALMCSRVGPHRGRDKDAPPQLSMNPTH